LPWVGEGLYPIIGPMTSVPIPNPVVSLSSLPSSLRAGDVGHLGRSKRRSISFSLGCSIHNSDAAPYSVALGGLYTPTPPNPSSSVLQEIHTKWDLARKESAFQVIVDIHENKMSK